MQKEPQLLGISLNGILAQLVAEVFHLHSSSSSTHVVSEPYDSGIMRHNIDMPHHHQAHDAHDAHDAAHRQPAGAHSMLQFRKHSMSIVHFVSSSEALHVTPGTSPSTGYRVLPAKPMPWLLPGAWPSQQLGCRKTALPYHHPSTADRQCRGAGSCLWVYGGLHAAPRASAGATSMFHICHDVPNPHLTSASRSCAQMQNCCGRTAH
jgi:hypothetical protein